MAVQGFQEPVKPGVWVFIALYLVGLLIVGGFFVRKNKSKTITPKDHFLAGKDMGWIVAMFSLYASSWSGYTEVGAPGEGYAQGWNFMRWVPGNVMFACWIGWLSPRIHFYAHKRDYVGTADFIADRYRNHILSILIVLFSVFPVCLYIMGQLKGVGTTMSAMTGYVEGQPSAFEGGQGLPEFSAALIFVIIMLFYEMVGGMAAIAMTDVVQAGILLFGFVLYYIISATTFGGVNNATDVFLECARMHAETEYQIGELWLDLAGEFDSKDTPPTAQQFLELTSKPKYMDDDDWKIYSKDDFAWREENEFFATKSGDDDDYFVFEKAPFAPLYLKTDRTCQLDATHVVNPAGAGPRLTVDGKRLSGWVGYHIGSIPFIVYPHVMDRYYAARDTQVMKAAIQLCHLSLWISAVPAVIIGYCVSATPGLGNVSNSNAVFANFIEYMIVDNWFLYIMGCLILSAAFAAYMSTADSGLMGFSSALSLDLAKHYIPPFNRADDPNQGRNLVYLGKVLSFIGAAVALVLTTIPELNFPLGDLYVWQGSFLFQCLPAYVLGFFCRWVCSWGVLAGFLSGIVTIIILNTWYADDVYGDLPHVFWSMLVNFGMCFVVEGLLRLVGQHPGFEPMIKKNFCGFPEMPEGFVGLSMKSVGGPEKEPFRPLWASALVIILCFVAIPYWAQPNNFEINYVAGVPYWAVIVFFLSACATLITMVQAHWYYDEWMTAEDRSKHSENPETELGKVQSTNDKAPNEDL